MPDAAPVDAQAGAPGWMLDAALLATVALLGLGIAAGGDRQGGTAALALGLAVHALISIFHGRFGRVRKVTWLMIFAGWAGVFLIRAPSPAAAVLFPLVGLMTGLGVLSDVIALHAPRLRTSRAAKIVAVLAFLAFAAGIVRDVLHLAGALDADAPQGPAAAIPLPIPFSPIAAIVRALPDFGGMAWMSALSLLPAAWPWWRSWRFHAAPTRLAYTLLWIGAACGWLTLGTLGALRPRPEIVAVLRAILVYEAAFFAIAPAVLARRVAPRAADDHETRSPGSVSSR